MDDFEKFKGLMYAASKIFDKEIDEELCGIYYEFLKKYEIRDIKWAFKRYTESNTVFFPKPGQIITILREAYDEIEKYNAVHQWAIVLHNLKSGVCHSENILTNKVIRLIGGWESIRMMMEEHEPFKRRDFVEHYMMLATREEVVASHRLALALDKKAKESLIYDEMPKLSLDNS